MAGWGPLVSTGSSGGGSGVIDLSDSVLSIYDSTSAVPPGVTSVVNSYLGSAAITHLMYVEFGGTNIARYFLTLDAVIIAQYITYFSGGLTGSWDFRSLVGGKNISENSVLQVSVVHQRPWAGEFYARLNLLSIVPEV